MEELLKLLVEGLPDAIGGLVSAAVIALLGILYAKVKKQPVVLVAVLITTIVLIGISVLYPGFSIWTIILIMVTLNGTLVCANLAFKVKYPKRYQRRKRKFVESQWICNHLRWRSWAICGKETWQYPRWRYLALMGLLIIPILAIIGVGWLEQPRDTIIILVADFEGPESQKYRVTETVLAHLHQVLKPYNDVQVKALGKSITEREGRTVARAEGKKHKASIVIWGWYGATETTVPLSVNFELLRASENFPKLEPEIQGDLQLLSIANLENFILQTRLSAEMAYLSLLTAGITRYEAKDWNGAVARFSDALEQIETDETKLSKSIVHLYRGHSYVFQGAYHYAIDDYNRTLEIDPSSVNAYNGRGAAYIGIRNYDQAIIDLNQALQLQPDLGEAHNMRALVYLRTGDSDRAIAEMNQVIELWNNASAYYNRGVIFSEIGDLDRAISDYTKSIQLKSDAKVYYNRGYVYQTKGDLNQAVADYNQAIRLRPNYAKAYANRGEAYTDQGNFNRAIYDLSKAIELNTPDLDLASVYAIRGDAYANIKKYDLAAADYNQAIQLKPDSAESYNGLGTVYAEKGDQDQAIFYFKRAIELQPDYAIAYINRGVSNLVNGDYDQAIADFNRAIELQYNKPNVYLWRGFAYAENHEINKAIPDCRKVLELSDDPNLRKQAADMLEALEAKQ